MQALPVIEGGHKETVVFLSRVYVSVYDVLFLLLLLFGDNTAALILLCVGYLRPDLSESLNQELVLVLKH